MSSFESDDDASSSGSESNSIESEHERSAPIMSIFASYYGIEEVAPEMKGTIDDANFNPEAFVKV
jgi:hypothetical protein